MDITETCSIQNFSLVDLGNLMDYNNIIMSNSFFKYNGGSPSISAISCYIEVNRITSVNLFYITETISCCGYPYFGIDTTSLDITISALDSTAVSILNQDLSDYGITVRSMYLNYFEFVLLFNLVNSNSITDVNVILGTMSNDFHKNYLIKKIDVGRSVLAFKFYQNIN